MAGNDAMNIVLVHGAFADGSGWRGVYDILKKDGFRVSVAQPSNISLEKDVAATRLVLPPQEQSTLLVGHSYGGVVITEAGNDPRVAGLVYVAAFVPAEGESVEALIKNPAPGAPVPPILPPHDGYLFLDRDKFHGSFAADLDPETAVFMADSQVPWGIEGLAGKISKAAWRTKPSWYLLATQDRMIPPEAQRFMSKRAGARVVEENGSHSIYVSKPQAVASLIAKAASSLKRAAA